MQYWCLLHLKITGIWIQTCDLTFEQNTEMVEICYDHGALCRVWNLGSSPEVMWEETIELSENTLKLEHHAYRLDGTKTGTQRSAAHVTSILTGSFRFSTV